MSKASDPTALDPMIQESAINIIAEGTRVEGKITFDRVSRVNGVLVGEVHARAGSQLILSETAVVEGDIFSDTLLIDGFVHGNIVSLGKVTVSRTGRVVGNIRAPRVELEFGSYFDGKCSMESVAGAGESGDPTAGPPRGPADGSIRGQQTTPPLAALTDVSP